MQTNLNRRDSGTICSIEERLVYFLCSKDQAKNLMPGHFRNATVIAETLESASVSGAPTPCDLSLDFHPPGLDSLYRFSFVISSVIRRTCDRMVIICGGNSPRMATNAALCTGAYLILCRDYCVEEVERLFRSTAASFIPYNDGIILSDCWRALAHARCYFVHTTS